MSAAFEDASGLTTTAASAEAVAAWDALLDAYGAFSPTVPERLRDLLTADPEMPLAQSARAALLLLSGKGEQVPAARRAAEQALRLAARGTPRERLHAEAVVAWTRGADDRAVTLWERILEAEPRDFLALKLAQFGHFYAGGGTPMLRSVEAVSDAWDPTVPRYSRYLGVRAFALEENGRLGEAEQCGREACDLAPDDPWAIHAVAHCLETRGAPAEGTSWIDGHAAHWSGAGTMDGHLRWHRALFALETEGADAVARDFAARYHVADSEEYLDLCNDVALLERLALRGVDVRAAREAVADAIPVRDGDHLLAFCDVHWVLGHAAAGRFAAAERVLDGMRERAAGDGPEAERWRRAGVPVAEGCLAYHRGAWAAAADAFGASRADRHLLGGSHAQRDLFEQLYLDALARAGRRAELDPLLRERTHLRPQEHWQPAMG
ncbi:MAG: tetratricopeptide repeat protein [Pseudomonadales bacterium]|nr:tetratricopeptide repeat protein [Pseudomonadales bacterium]